MKLQLLDKNRLKVILEKDDLSYYDLSFATIDCKDRHTKEVFYSVIEQAKIQTGFNPKDKRLLIEAYPEDNGNILLYFTKIVSEKNESTELVYEFAQIDDILDSFKIFKKSFIRTFDFNIYKLKDKYFLSFIADTDDNASLSSMMLELNEYGKHNESFNKKSYLDEYAILLCENFSI
ncbi:MAG: adaptor protein MecA [Ruminococcaceae bacterium]|nr:adaptor protein MecA [Oscillospiraceae bacterium]